MVTWQVIAAVILVVSLILLALIITRATLGAENWVTASFRAIKSTFCCKLMGCQPGWITWSRLNFICDTACAGCACGEACEI